MTSPSSVATTTSRLAMSMDVVGLSDVIEGAEHIQGAGIMSFATALLWVLFFIHDGIVRVGTQ